MVELRKRKAPEPAPAPPAKKKSNPIKAAINKAKTAVGKKSSATTNGSTSASKVTVGDTITLEGFGGEIETNDGEKTTLQKLVEESKSGVVIFTYPKASTPGCTTQVCLFRDSYEPLTSTGLSIYGLSTDSPKSNTTFKTKQNLPYPLLCDPGATLIAAIGMKKAPKGTTRGVFVVEKSGKVVAAEPGSPAATVETVKKLVAAGGEETETGKAEEGKTEEPAGNVEEPKEEATAVEAPPAPATEEEKKEDAELAKVASDVADTAAKLDGEVKA